MIVLIIVVLECSSKLNSKCEPFILTPSMFVGMRYPYIIYNKSLYDEEVKGRTPSYLLFKFRDDGII